MAEWYDNIDRRGYNYYDGAQEYNPLFDPNKNPNYGKSFTGIGRFDYNNLNRLPSNLTQDLGASTYQAPPVYPGQRNIHEGFGTADVSSTFQAPEKKGFNFNFPSILNFAKGAINRYNPLYEGSKNYNPALKGQVDAMNKYNMLSGTGGKTGPYQIRSGALGGQNLVSMFGSNDVMKMYDKQIARHDKTIQGFAEQWSNLKDGTPEEQALYDKKLAVHQKKKDDAKKEKLDALAAIGATGDGTGAATTGGAVDTGGGGYQDQGGYSTQGGFTGKADPASGGAREHHGNWADGGRIGYNRGRVVNPGGYQGDEFEDENVLEFMQDQGIPHSEMAETSPFEMRIQQLMDEGMSWQEAYEIASQEFATAEGGEDSFNQEGIASLV